MGAIAYRNRWAVEVDGEDLVTSGVKPLARLAELESQGLEPTLYRVKLQLVGGDWVMVSRHKSEPIRASWVAEWQDRQRRNQVFTERLSRAWQFKRMGG
tara:strand:+ start:5389 stop:5685 length:297 start_codon:yes stop_codon:yes gene_type:complete